MSHKCLKCGKVLEGDSNELLQGCNNCGHKLFVYQEGDEDIDKGEREDVVRDVENFLEDIGEKEKLKTKLKKGIEFDLQSIKVLDDGVYEINLRKLLEEIPLIVEIREGKYFIHLPSLFKDGKEKAISLEDFEVIESEG